MRRMSRRRKSTLFSAVIVAIAALCTYFFMGGPSFPIENRASDRGRAGGFYPRAGEGARAANSILRCWASRRDADSPAQRADYAH